MAENFILNLNQLTSKDSALVGAKAANLGQLTQLGLPTPLGFVISSEAFSHFLDHHQLTDKINSLLKQLNAQDTTKAKLASKHIKKLIRSLELPDTLTQPLQLAYQQLQHQVPLTVRSSVIGEDSPTASFAGQYLTVFNITSKQKLHEAIKNVWASLFNAKSLYYRHLKNHPLEKTHIGIIVQPMVMADTSGVIFTANPITKDTNTVLIEAVWGLGEVLAQGSITPDQYTINKTTNEILTKNINPQQIKLHALTTETRLDKVSSKQVDQPKLTDKQILKLAKYSQQIETYFQHPQDIEWVLYQEKIYLLQTRPITTIPASTPKKTAIKKTIQIPTGSIPTPMLHGIPANQGFTTGRAKVISKLSDYDTIKRGDIIVTTSLKLTNINAIKQANAIITDTGGASSNAAIISRELNIPCIVDCEKATKTIKSNQILSIDANSGNIYHGKISTYQEKLNLPSKVNSIHQLNTKTEIYIDLTDFEQAITIAAKSIDGVGLLSGDRLYHEYVGIHPRYLLERNRTKIAVAKLSEELSSICHAFQPRPIIYQLTQADTHYYRQLIHGKRLESREYHPQFGLRGAYRHLSFPRESAIELQTIQHVRTKLGFQNLHLQLPFVRSVKELTQFKSHLSSFGLPRRSNFNLYLNISLPSQLLMLDELIDQGVDGLTIDVKQLTAFILAIDPNNPDQLSQFGPTPAVYKALELIINTAKRRQIESILVNIPNFISETSVQDFLSWGLSGISVKSVYADKTKILVHNLEARLSPKPKGTKPPVRQSFLQRLFT